MAEITASMVKDLRAKTDAPMMECKKALTEANGDTAEHTVTNAYTLTVPTGPAPAR